MENHWSSSPNSYVPPSTSDDFFEFNKSAPNNSIVQVSPPQSQASMDSESLNQLKLGFAKMMQTMERLEQRLNRVEQTTNQILKNQQEVLTTPFMSQTELDQARKVAEQLEHDTSVAKQLQAAYNKEVEVRKAAAAMMSQCPLCGARVSQLEIESHVDKCLEMFSSDPKKQVEVKETKQKVESGFFSRLYKTTSSKTEKTKVISNMPPSSNTPLLSDQDNGQHQMMVSPGSYYPPQFAYPSYPPYSGSPHQPPHQPHPQMIMPMYMYNPQMHHGSPNE